MQRPCVIFSESPEIPARSLRWLGRGILAAQKLLAHKEGVFCEPASAISLAGALRDVKNGKIPAGSRIVCTLTGQGLKDPDTAIKQSTTPLIKIEAELNAVKGAILDNMTG